jgi:PLAC8 family protein
MAGVRRTSMREKYGIYNGDGCEDVCTHFWCLSCANAQEAREIHIRKDLERRAQSSHGAVPIGDNGVTVRVRTPAGVASSSTADPYSPAVTGADNSVRALFVPTY